MNPDLEAACLRCGGAVPPKAAPGGVSKVYCSPRCRDRARWERNREAAAARARARRKAARGGVRAVRTLDPLQRFLAKVRLDDGVRCWEWTAARAPVSAGSGGYGSFGRRWAHRVSYEMFRGPIPEGMQLDHLCRVRHCVNPWHLDPVSARENQRRSPLTFASVHGFKTHCPAGHPYDESNTYRQKDGSRKCRACHRERARARRRNLGVPEGTLRCP